MTSLTIWCQKTNLWSREVSCLVQSMSVILMEEGVKGVGLINVPKEVLDASAEAENVREAVSKKKGQQMTFLFGRRYPCPVLVPFSMPCLRCHKYCGKSDAGLGLTLVTSCRREDDTII